MIKTRTIMAVKDYEARVYIGSRFRSLREKRGMTLEDVAEKTTLKPKAIQRIEEGKYDVGIDRLSVIARALDARLDIC